MSIFKMLPTKRMIKSMHKMRLLEMHIIVVRVLHYLFLLWPTFILLSRQVKTFWLYLKQKYKNENNSK